MPDDVAIAGPDGKRAADLMAAAKAHGSELLTRLAGRAVERLLGSPRPLAAPVLLTDDELRELQAALASTIAAADLLGRVRVRERARRAADRNGVTLHADAADGDDPFRAFAEPVPAQPPAAAVKYFRKLVPSLSGDPGRYGPLLDRHAFTLAHAADQVLLDKVKQTIADRLTGADPAPGGPAVEDVLEAAGVSPSNPQYGEMVFRTNMMDAYNQGAVAEMAEPDMRAVFPAWRYDGVLDERTGDDHRPRIGRYYPADAPFHLVRGPRVFNCRCVLPGQFIRGRILLASEAWYTGQAVEIVTAQGARLAVTANHPVLTARGWVPAGKVREGDDLFDDPLVLDRLVIGDDVQHEPTRVEDVFRSLPEGDALRVSKRWTSLDFHGDGPSIQGDIEIKGAARGLLCDLGAGIAEGIRQFLFGGGDRQPPRLAGGGPCLAASPVAVGIVAPEFDTCGDQSEGDAATVSLVCATQFQDGHAAVVLGDQLANRQLSAPPTISPGADRVPGVAEPPLKSFALHPDLSGEREQRLPGRVPGGKSVEVGNGFGERQSGRFATGPRLDQFVQPLAQGLSIHQSQAHADGLDSLAASVAAHNVRPVEAVVSAPAVAHGCGFTAAAEFEPNGGEYANDLFTAEAGIPLKVLHRLAVGVANDKVQCVRVFHYDGPVYDFMTRDGYYAIGYTPGSMRVVHNCSPTPVSKWDLGGVRVETSW